MRISDWSSDVCSSDLRPAGEDANALLDPRTIREWVEARQPARAARIDTSTMALEVECVRPVEAYRQQRLVVLPLAEADELYGLTPPAMRWREADRKSVV